MRSESELRRAVQLATHRMTGTFEPWKHIGGAKRRYHDSSIGMTATERWDSMGYYELEYLTDALEEREAIRRAPVGASRGRGGGSWRRRRADCCGW
jgi:hypothetical protein